MSLLNLDEIERITGESQAAIRDAVVARRQMYPCPYCGSGLRSALDACPKTGCLSRDIADGIALDRRCGL